MCVQRARPYGKRLGHPRPAGDDGGNPAGARRRRNRLKPLWRIALQYTVGESNVKVLAVIPARNEAESLPAVVRSLRADQPDIDILVVDDESDDATRRLLPGLGVEWLRLSEHLGIGGAIRAGLRYARGAGYDVVVRVDGDGQHPASEIDHMIAPLFEGHADAVIGSRFSGSAGYQTPPGIRRMGQRLVAAWVSAATGVRVTDATSGFWAFGLRAIRFLTDHHPTGYPEPELLLVLAHSGLRVTEVPIHMNKRLAGRTSLTAGRVGIACATTALALLVAPLRRPVREAGGG
jgi:glycosyltransferase involved in cell wall biosynthesis